MGAHRLRHKRKIHNRYTIEKPKQNSIINPKPIEQDTKWIEVMDMEEKYEQYLNTINKS